MEGAENFAEGVVVVAAAEGEESEEGGLEGAKRLFLEGIGGGGFYFAGDGGRKSGGIKKVSGEKEDGFEGLAAWTCGGEKWREWRKGKSIEKSLDARGGIGAEVLAKPKANRFTEEESESGRGCGGGSFEGEAGGGEDEFEARIAGAEGGEIGAGGEESAGGLENGITFGEVHGLGEEGEAKASAEVFGVEKRG